MPKYTIEPETLAKFPPREQEALGLMADGINSPSVLAEKLHIEVSSVNNLLNGTKKNGSRTEIGIRGIIKELTGVETTHDGFIMTLVRNKLATRRE